MITDQDKQRCWKALCPHCGFLDAEWRDDGSTEYGVAKYRVRCGSCERRSRVEVMTSKNRYFWAVVSDSDFSPTLFNSEKIAKRIATRWNGYHPEEKHRCVKVELVEVE